MVLSSNYLLFLWTIDSKQHTYHSIIFPFENAHIVDILTGGVAMNYINIYILVTSIDIYQPPILV